MDTGKNITMVEFRFLLCFLLYASPAQVFANDAIITLITYLFTLSRCSIYNILRTVKNEGSSSI